MWRMNVSASIQNSSRSPSPDARQDALNTSRENRTWSVSVGVNAVKSWVPTKASAHADNAPAIERTRPVQRSPALQRAPTRTGQEQVRVRPGGRVAPGVEPVRRHGAIKNRHILRQQRVQTRHRRRRTLVRRHLAQRVNPGVGPTGDCERYTVRTAKQNAERALNLPFDTPPPGLLRPAGEPAPVILEQEPRDRRRAQTSSSSTISVESERRGPSFRIRV